MSNCKLILASLGALALTACASTEGTATESKAPEAAEATADADQPRPERKVVAAGNDDGKLICKKKKKTGSRLGGSEVCYTKAEWDRIAEMAKNDLKRTTDNTSTKGN